MPNWEPADPPPVEQPLRFEDRHPLTRFAWTLMDLFVIEGLLFLAALIVSAFAPSPFMLRVFDIIGFSVVILVIVSVAVLFLAALTHTSRRDTGDE